MVYVLAEHTTKELADQLLVVHTMIFYEVTDTQQFRNIASKYLYQTIF